MTIRRNEDDRARAPIWVGLLLLVSGFGLLFGMRRLPMLSRYWLGPRQYAMGAIAVVLAVWGLKQIFSALYPEANLRRWIRYRMMATREGIVYVAIMSVLFVGSVLGRSNMLMLVFAMMIGPWVLNGWIAFSMLKRMRAARQLPRRAMAGDLTDVGIEIQNRKWFLSSWLLAAEDEVRHARDRLKPATLFVRVPAGQSRRGNYYVRFSQRGVYSFGPIELTTTFPLGLIKRGLRCDEFAELIVHPRIGRLTARWRGEVWHASELARRRATHVGLFDDEFHRVREFRPGDNPKAIHWRTTARRNELMVREFHQSRDLDLVLLVELWQPEHPTTSDLDRVELAVSFAATVIHDQWSPTRAAHWVATIGGDRIQQWSSGSEPDAWRDALAVALASPAADLRALFDESLARARINCRIVLISSRPRDEVRAKFPQPADCDDVLCLSSDPCDLAAYFDLEAGA